MLRSWLESGFREPSRSKLNPTYCVLRQTSYAIQDAPVVLRSLSIQQQGFEGDGTYVGPDP